MAELFTSPASYLVLALLVGAGAASYAWSARRSRRSMVLVAQRLGLGAEVDGSGWRMEGVLDGVEVRVERYSGGVPRGATGVSARCAGIPGDVYLRSEPRLEPGDDLRVGDPAFDDRLCLFGAQDAALAVLREPARKAILGLAPAFRQLSLVRDGLGVELQGLGSGPDLLESHLRTCVRLAKLLAVGPVRDALAANALSDPLPGVRIRNLEALREVSDPAFAAAVLEKTLQDPDQAVRTFAQAALAKLAPAPPKQEKA